LAKDVGCDGDIKVGLVMLTSWTPQDYLIAHGAAPAANALTSALSGYKVTNLVGLLGHSVPLACLGMFNFIREAIDLALDSLARQP
jgi:hypothetical protein